MMCRSLAMRSPIRKQSLANQLNLVNQLTNTKGHILLNLSPAIKLGQTAAMSTVPKQTSWRDGRTWYWFRRIFRIGRTVLLAGSLYAAGYTAGMQEVVSDPRGFVRSQIRDLMDAQGASFVPPDCDEGRAIARVLPRVIRAAKSHIKEMRSKVRKDPILDADDKKQQVHQHAKPTHHHHQVAVVPIPIA
jgi:hypothetical protein